MRPSRKQSLYGVVLIGLLAAGCQTNPSPVAPATPLKTPVHEAVAVVYPTRGNTALGTVWFTDVPGGVRVVGEFHGLPVDSRLGFHIHEFGDCTAPDASSAGGHYNPEGHSHGGSDSPSHHAGDLGNIRSSPAGDAYLDITAPDVSIDGVHPILGRSVVIHARQDDLHSQPAGNSGPRIGCGVIGIAVLKQ